MKKRTVGIYSKYDASEQSLCAMFLTRYIDESYRYTKWFVPEAATTNSPYTGFSHQWDAEVLDWQRTDLDKRSSVEICDTFFFFERNKELFDLLPPKAITVFILDPRRQDPKDRAFSEKCTWTFVTSEAWLQRYPFLTLMENLAIWPYDPYIPCIMRRSLDYDRHPKLFFPAFGLTLSERKLVEQTAELVKLCLPHVQIVVGFYDARVEKTPGIDSLTYDWRLLRYLQNSDWLIDLNPRPFYTLFPACAGGYGLQWIGFDVMPNTDDYCAARRHLIKTKDGLLPDLEFVAEQIVRFLATPFHDDKDRHRHAGAWDKRRAEFLRVTNKILGIKSRY